ncbi:MAG: family 78 glycoside hydrolase catalytic domain, partial [Lachnospiraceae bacterium]|nr:family 78 glycoside hydrolase catalytic domain [Lachnospiraceae bacterium]
MVDVTAYYNDGTKEQLINTNDVSNWKAMDADNDVFGYESGNTAQRNTYLSSTGYYSVPMENINTNYYPYGFKEATYDVSAWNTAVENLYDSTITDGYYIELKPYQSENVMANEVASKNVFQNSEGDIIFDIGEQTFGILRINFNSNIATDINVYQGYMMDGDNVDYTLNSGIKYNETWTIKEGSNSFDTVINKNFRYLQIETDNLDEATIISIMSSLNNVKAIEMTRLNGGIELSNVCFRYGDDMPWVVDGMNLKIRPGEYV